MHLVTSVASLIYFASDRGLEQNPRGPILPLALVQLWYASSVYLRELRLKARLESAYCKLSAPVVNWQRAGRSRPACPTPCWPGAETGSESPVWSPTSQADQRDIM